MGNDVSSSQAKQRLEREVGDLIERTATQTRADNLVRPYKPGVTSAVIRSIENVHLREVTERDMTKINKKYSLYFSETRFQLESLSGIRELGKDPCSLMRELDASRNKIKSLAWGSRSRDRSIKRNASPNSNETVGSEEPGFKSKLASLIKNKASSIIVHDEQLDQELEYLVNIKKIWLDSNLLKDLCLASQVKLQVLSVSNNLLRSVVLRLPSLVYLNLSHNNLRSIPQLGACPNLQYLILGHNMTCGKGLRNLITLKHLRVLDLSRNNIKWQISPTADGKQFRKFLTIIWMMKGLRGLSLLNNPVVDEKFYQYFILKYNRRLQLLDDQELNAFTINMFERPGAEACNDKNFIVEHYNDYKKRLQEKNNKIAEAIEREQLRLSLSRDVKVGTGFDMHAIGVPMDMPIDGATMDRSSPLMSEGGISVTDILTMAGVGNVGGTIDLGLPQFPQYDLIDLANMVITWDSMECVRRFHTGVQKISDYTFFTLAASKNNNRDDNLLLGTNSPAGSFIVLRPRRLTFSTSVNPSEIINGFLDLIIVRLAQGGGLSSSNVLNNNYNHHKKVAFKESVGGYEVVGIAAMLDADIKAAEVVFEERSVSPETILLSTVIDLISITDFSLGRKMAERLAHLVVAAPRLSRRVITALYERLQLIFSQCVSSQQKGSSAMDMWEIFKLEAEPYMLALGHISMYCSRDIKKGTSISLFFIDWLQSHQLKKVIEILLVDPIYYQHNDVAFVNAMIKVFEMYSTSYKIVSTTFSELRVAQRIEDLLTVSRQSHKGKVSYWSSSKSTVDDDSQFDETLSENVFHEKFWNTCTLGCEERLSVLLNLLRISSSMCRTAPSITSQFLRMRNLILDQAVRHVNFLPGKQNHAQDIFAAELILCLGGIVKNISYFQEFTILPMVFADVAYKTTDEKSKGGKNSTEKYVDPFKLKSILFVLCKIYQRRRIHPRLFAACLTVFLDVLEMCDSIIKESQMSLIANRKRVENEKFTTVNSPLVMHARRVQLFITSHLFEYDTMMTGYNFSENTFKSETPHVSLLVDALTSLKERYKDFCSELNSSIDGIAPKVFEQENRDITLTFEGIMNLLSFYFGSDENAQRLFHIQVGSVKVDANKSSLNSVTFDTDNVENITALTAPFSSNRVSSVAAETPINQSYLTSDHWRLILSQIVNEFQNENVERRLFEMIRSPSVCVKVAAIRCLANIKIQKFEDDDMDEMCRVLTNCEDFTEDIIAGTMRNLVEFGRLEGERGFNFRKKNAALLTIGVLDILCRITSKNFAPLSIQEQIEKYRVCDGCIEFLLELQKWDTTAVEIMQSGKGRSKMITILKSEEKFGSPIHPVLIENTNCISCIDDILEHLRPEGSNDDINDSGTINTLNSMNPRLLCRIARFIECAVSDDYEAIASMDVLEEKLVCDLNYEWSQIEKKIKRNEIIYELPSCLLNDTLNYSLMSEGRQDVRYIALVPRRLSLHESPELPEDDENALRRILILKKLPSRGNRKNLLHILQTSIRGDISNWDCLSNVYSESPIPLYFETLSDFRSRSAVFGEVDIYSESSPQNGNDEVKTLSEVGLLKSSDGNLLLSGVAISNQIIEDLIDISRRIIEDFIVFDVRSSDFRIMDDVSDEFMLLHWHSCRICKKHFKGDCILCKPLSILSSSPLRALEAERRQNLLDGRFCAVRSSLPVSLLQGVNSFGKSISNGVSDLPLWPKFPRGRTISSALRVITSMCWYCPESVRDTFARMLRDENTFNLLACVPFQAQFLQFNIGIKIIDLIEIALSLPKGGKVHGDTIPNFKDEIQLYRYAVLLMRGILKFIDERLSFDTKHISAYASKSLVNYHLLSKKTKKFLEYMSLKLFAQKINLSGGLTLSDREEALIDSTARIYEMLSRQYIHLCRRVDSSMDSDPIERELRALNAAELFSHIFCLDDVCIFLRYVIYTQRLQKVVWGHIPNKLRQRIQTRYNIISIVANFLVCSHPETRYEVMSVVHRVEADEKEFFQFSFINEILLLFSRRCEEADLERYMGYPEHAFSHMHNASANISGETLISRYIGCKYTNINYENQTNTYNDYGDLSFHDSTVYQGIHSPLPRLELGRFKWHIDKYGRHLSTANYFKDSRGEPALGERIEDHFWMFIFCEPRSKAKRILCVQTNFSVYILKEQFKSLFYESWPVLETFEDRFFYESVSSIVIGFSGHMAQVKYFVDSRRTIRRSITLMSKDSRHINILCNRIIKLSRNNSELEFHRVRIKLDTLTRSIMLNLVKNIAKDGFDEQIMLELIPVKVEKSGRVMIDDIMFVIFPSIILIFRVRLQYWRMRVEEEGSDRLMEAIENFELRNEFFICTEFDDAIDINNIEKGNIRNDNIGDTPRCEVGFSRSSSKTTHNNNDSGTSMTITFGSFYDLKLFVDTMTYLRRKLLNK